MKEYNIKQIVDLNHINTRELLKESKNEGFRLFERLINDYENGSNTFNKKGEILYGVFLEDGQIIAIGGMNVDPYSPNEKVGRLRRFYVSKQYRRSGIGNMLLEKLIDHARQHFSAIVLRTNTVDAHLFYTAFGFHQEELFPESSHYLQI